MSNYDDFGAQGKQNNDVLEWGQSLTADVNEFTVLPAGDYDFTITKVEKKYYEPKPGAKLPPCPEADLTIDIQASEGRASLTHRLFWHKSTQFRIAEAFIACGLAKKDEDFISDPDLLMGKSGRCTLSKQPYQKNDGTSGIRNEISKMMPAENSSFGGF